MDPAARTFRGRAARAAAAERERHEQLTLQRLASLHGLDKVAWSRMAYGSSVTPWTVTDLILSLTIEVGHLAEVAQEAAESMKELCLLWTE
jgi:hypothetical protein